MPIRPALAAIHPRKPQPRDVRSVLCPHCTHRFEVSYRAISLRCPACTRPLRFEDVVIRHRLTGELATMGTVQLVNPSEVIGRLTCGKFLSGGRFEGTVTAFGDIELTPQSFTAGQIVGRSFSARYGCVVRAKINIRPKPVEPARPQLPKPAKPAYRI